MSNEKDFFKASDVEQDMSNMVAVRLTDPNELVPIAGADCDFRINGQPMPVNSVSWERNQDVGVDLAIKGKSVSISYTIRLDADEGRALFDFFDAFGLPRPHGASDLTLAKRASYQSRKGRSAIRRMLKLGYAGIIRIVDLPWLPITRDWSMRSILYAGGEARIFGALQMGDDEFRDFLSCIENVELVTGLRRTPEFVPR